MNCRYIALIGLALFVLSGCAGTDHSRTLVQYNIACEGGLLKVDIDSLLEKANESSSADSKSEGSLSLPMVGR